MDSETSVYEKLISQCKSNDIDVKVDSLTKLQAEFEKGNVKVADPDAIISILKSSLRTSNLLLTNATLSALPIILPLLISHSTNQAQLTPASLSSSVSTASVGSSGALDVATLRQALTSFLPAGGVIDRLGDKERAQLKARDTLVILGGFAFRSGSGVAISRAGKGVETPIAIFERLLKEGGLASKVWKVREQSILTLVYIRRAHHLFPIRPYLSLLVDCLEDTDPHVRECARQSIVELFSGPGVTDAARADLKKELLKKGVRKTIVDGVLSKLLAGAIGNNSQSHEGSENDEGTNPSKNKEYIPPSMALLAKKPQAVAPGGGMARTVSHSSFKELQRPASRAAEASPPPQILAENLELHAVYVASSRDLENEFAAMHKPFEGKETEHNWAVRDQSVQRVRGMLKGDVHVRFLDTFLIALKDGFIQWSLKTLASLRTTVAVNTCLLYVELATTLGPLLDPFSDVLLTSLLRMANFTKKITAQHSQASVTAILARTSAQPRLVLPLLWQTLQEKTVQARAFVVAHLKQYVEVHGQRSKIPIESSNSLEILEKCLKRALADSNPAVRESARLLFWDFEQIWQERGHAIMETLDAPARKQLEKACPNANLPTAILPSTPKPSKKSSVAAAIAASRAKAKAIATAPPTLRHQATSASYSAPLRQSGSPNLSPKNSTARPSSPQRTTTSPSPSRHRVVSASLTRSTSLTSVPIPHVRTLSSGSSRVPRVPSPSLSDQSTRRRTSSPLVGSKTTFSIRKALQIALPASPPSSVGQLSPTPLSKSTGRNGIAIPLPLSQVPSQSLNLVNCDDSLLVAQSVPIPEDGTDSEDDCMSMNLMSFSAPFEMYPPIETENSPLPSDSKLMVPIALSSGSISDMNAGQPVVEDALRARAEQAESAAERLLELVEPEDEGIIRHPSLPSLIKNSNGTLTAKTKAENDQVPGARVIGPPVTPNNRATTIMRQAALFADSPAHDMRSSSLLDVLRSRKQETGWWMKRKALFAQASPVATSIDSERIEELKRHIASLSCGDADTTVLKELVIICIENTVEETPSPSSPTASNHSSSPSSLKPRLTSSLHSDLWETNRLFEQFFGALNTYLEPSRSEEELSYGLIIIWAILENQAPYIEGRESDLMSMILRVRYCNKIDVLEGTNAIRDALTTKLDPVYGLTTMHASLRVFYADAPPSLEGEEVKAATFAFGLMALGKYFLRLPAEIAEEELPRLKNTLISALNDRSSLIVRESAAACIIAAQLVLRDETHLFALLDGLADEKKNLLTYLFDKHGARGALPDNGHSGIDKLEREIRRLDTRTSTPLRSG